jgi:hypothetical protein
LAVGVIWYRLRADLRVRWRALALLAVLVGLGGGVALTAFAGARRTSSAVPQMLAYSRPDDGNANFARFGRPSRVIGTSGSGATGRRRLSARQRRGRGGGEDVVWTGRDPGLPGVICWRRRTAQQRSPGCVRGR